MSKVIEIVNFKLKPSTTDEVFVEETKRMERDFLGKLHGFIDRDTGKSENGDWVVVLHWQAAADAQASMDKFVGDEGSKAFTDLIDMQSFRMTRYALEDHYQ